MFPKKVHAYDLSYNTPYVQQYNLDVNTNNY